MEFLNCLKEDLIDPLKTFMNEQNNAGKKLNNDIRKVEKDFKDAVDKMDKVIFNLYFFGTKRLRIFLQALDKKSNKWPIILRKVFQSKLY